MPYGHEGGVTGGPAEERDSSYYLLDTGSGPTLAEAWSSLAAIDLDQVFDPDKMARADQAMANVGLPNSDPASLALQMAEYERLTNEACTPSVEEGTPELPESDS